MNSLKYLPFLVAFITGTNMFAQTEKPVIFPVHPALPCLTIEPGIGIHTNFGTDFLISNLVQWNPVKHLGIASHSSFNLNNITQRYFNGIKTNYNFSINQKFGIGTTLYSKRRSYTFLLMAGAKYTAYRETLDDERFEKTGRTIRTVSPDYGMMYTQKKILKKYFFTYRIYVPLYPWPAKGANILYADSNMDNIALEAGIGIKIF